MTTYAFDKRRAAFFRKWVAGCSIEEASCRLTELRQATERSRGLDWEFLGPTSIGGRLTSIALHPRKPETLWVGSAGGGVWKSEDGGKTWQLSWDDHAETLNIGSLAVDPQSPEVLYCGTGEANLSGDAYPGVGIYRSEDGGACWEVAIRADPVASPPVPRRIGALAVDAGNKTVWAGGVRHEPSEPVGGLLCTEDGGASWERMDLVFQFAPGEGYQAHAVLAAESQVITAITEEAAEGIGRSGIWWSKDAGGHWFKATWPIPDDVSVGRIALDWCRGDRKHVYALVGGTDQQLVAVLHSEDGGQSFEEILRGPVSDEAQMAYNCVIAVHPEKAGTLAWGGVDLYRSQDYGATWDRATRWSAARGDSDYAHADHHGLVWAVRGRDDLLYDSNDGGLDFSKDGGWSFENRSTGLEVTQLALQESWWVA